MKHSEVLNRYVNTGSQIPEEQYKQLSQSLQKSYIRMRGVVGYEDWEFQVINDNQRINYIEIKGVKLSHYNIQDLLKNSENKDLIATKIIETKGKELEYINIYYLINNSDNKDDIATKIIEVKGELSDSEIRTLMVVKYSNTDDIATKLIEKFGEKLDSDNLKTIMLFSSNKKSATKIIEIKGEKLNSKDIGNLLEYLSFSERYEIATKIIETKGKELNGDDIYALFILLYFNIYIERKELIKKTLLQNGVDYRLINKQINRYNSESTDSIPLIPDNYQSMLNEIRRIKQIMG
jgi:hypothetical protein